MADPVALQPGDLCAAVARGIVIEPQAAKLIALGVVFPGPGLLLAGVQWGRLRAVIMRALPPFPGKDRLPPYVVTP